MKNNDGALSGVKVLDLSRVLAGPWASQTLADMGANVLKIERPDVGDDTRHWGPPFINDDKDISAYFSCANRNKKSVFIDLKTQEGVQQIKDLAKEADILIENYKAGHLAKLDLGYDNLVTLNPQLIYCSITGFGQTGPYSNKPGYDLLIQAMCGLMSVTGEADGQPQKTGVAITDLFTGLYASTAILAALHERSHSGLGQYIDLALFDVGTAIMANQASNYLVGGQSPSRLGNMHPNIVPYQSFETADGYCVIAVGNNQQFQKFCQAIDAHELASDKRYTTNSLRVENREPLVEKIQTILLTKSTSLWLDILEQQAIPSAPVNNVADALSDPQIIHRDLRVDMDVPSGESIPVVGNPIKFSRTPVQYHTAPSGINDAEKNTPDW